MVCCDCSWSRKLRHLHGSDDVHADHNRATLSAQLSSTMRDWMAGSGEKYDFSMWLFL